MKPGTTPMIFVLGLAVLAASCGRSSDVEQAERSVHVRVASIQYASVDNPLHTIVMPHDEPPFPPGAGREEFVTACVVCHSPRYITMQPRFPRATWLSEVKKMQDNYGAHVTDAQAVKIADYLFSINGKAGSGTAPKGTYGE